MEIYTIKKLIVNMIPSNLFQIRSLTVFNASLTVFGGFSFGSCFFFSTCCCCFCCCFFLSSFSFVLCSFPCTLAGFLFSLFPSRLSYSVFTWLNGTEITYKSDYIKSDIQLLWYKNKKLSKKNKKPLFCTAPNQVWDKLSFGAIS